jgi:dihydroneopterin aldolase
MNPSEREVASQDRILLEGMVFHGRHGTLPAERELGQPFVVDVELRLDLRTAGLSDSLGETVDYGEVHRQAKEIVEGEPVNLTETVAERIAAAILDGHPSVEAVRVKVAKPHVRLDDTVLAGSAVEILRHSDVDHA